MTIGELSSLVLELLRRVVKQMACFGRTVTKPENPNSLDYVFGLNPIEKNS